MYEVAPFGERRKDLRAAVMTANLMTMQMSKKVADDEFRSIVHGLMKYLPDESTYEDADDLAALERMKNSG